MKSIKIWSLIAMLCFAFVGCENPDNGDNSGNNSNGGNSDSLVGEWKLVSWCNAAPEFNVYIDFNEDGTFEMYQQVYSLNYELYAGTYTVSKGVLSGKYSDMQAWSDSYTCKVETVSGVKQLQLVSQTDATVVSIYETTTISDDVKAEATETRAAGTERFL